MVLYRTPDPYSDPDQEAPGQQSVPNHGFVTFVPLILTWIRITGHLVNTRVRIKGYMVGTLRDTAPSQHSDPDHGFVPT
jgi:hypothetical protein